MASSSSGRHGAAAAKHRSVLTRFTCNSLRIPDELAEEIAAEEAVVVGPHSKVWRVGVGWDTDGAFLGLGWRAFAAACGVEPGWLLVLRHRGNGLLTLKAFDGDGCRTELGAQTTAPAADATLYYKGASCKPQFINVFSTKSMGKMLIPSRFVQHCIHKEHMNNRMAIVSGPLGKVFQIELEMNQSDMFFAGGWSHFIAFHGITEADALLLRYEGNMAFTVKVFGPDGCQSEFMHKDGRMQPNELEITSTLNDTERQHEISSASSRKCKRKYKRINNWPDTDEQRRPKGFVTCLKKKNKSSETNCAYDLGPPARLTDNERQHDEQTSSYSTAPFLQRHWFPEALHDYAPGLHWQHQFLAGARSPLQEWWLPAWIGLEEGLPGHWAQEWGRPYPKSHQNHAVGCHHHTSLV